MLRIISFCIAVMLAISLRAESISQSFGYKLCNHHKFTFLLLKAYDVYLCTDSKQYLYPEEIFKTDFSLIIKYNMNFEKEELAKTSIEEINRYYDISKKDQNIYYNQLVSIFPSIKKGDIVEAKYNKKGTTYFYHNKLPIGKINKARFSKIFLDIWLYKDNKYKKMTKDLFEIDG